MTDSAPIRRIVICLGLAETLIWAATFYLFPALLPHWENDLNWSRTSLAAIYSGSLIVSALCSPLIGRLIDHGYGREVLTISTLSAAAILLALSLVNSITFFAILWLMLGVSMAGALYEPCFSHLTHLLGAEAKRAITLVTLIAGFAGTVSFPGAYWVTVGLGFGWRGAVVAFALAAALIAAPLMWWSSPKTLILRTIDKRQVKPPSGGVRKIVNTPCFWFLATAFAFLMLNHGIIISHLLPLLEDRAIDSQMAVLAAAGIGPMQVAGRILMLALERFVRFHAVSNISFLLLLLASSTLILMTDLPPLVAVFVIAQGAGWGMVSIIRPVLTAEFLGRTHFGTVSGLMVIPFLGAAALAPTLGALIWRWGGYDTVLVICLLLPILGWLSYLAAATTRRHFD